VQAGPDAVYCHRRCADLEFIDRLAVIRAFVSAAVLDALPDPRRALTVDTGCTNSRPGECRRTEGMCAAATSLGEHLRCLLVKRGGLRHHDLAMRRPGHHYGVLPAGPGPGHGDRAGPHAARRRHRRGHHGQPARWTSQRGVPLVVRRGRARRPAGRGPRDKDRGPDQSSRENQRAPAPARPGSTTRSRRGSDSRSPAPAEHAGVPHRPCASRRREPVSRRASQLLPGPYKLPALVHAWMKRSNADARARP
jgi:hypothetical protein